MLLIGNTRFAVYAKKAYSYQKRGLYLFLNVRYFTAHLIFRVARQIYLTFVSIG